MKLAIGFVGLVFAAISLFLAYSEGRSDVMTHTTVFIVPRASGYGPYFGECMPIGEMVACAADKRNNFRVN